MTQRGRGRGGPWSPEEDEILCRTFATGRRWISVAVTRLPKRTSFAIMMRVSKLGLKAGDRTRMASDVARGLAEDHKALVDVREIVREPRRHSQPGDNVPAFLRDLFAGWGVR